MGGLIERPMRCECAQGTHHRKNTQALKRQDTVLQLSVKHVCDQNKTAFGS